MQGVKLADVTAQLPGAEDRPGQEQMAELVAEAIDSGRHLVVQAGTGTGKTLAYLVPAIASGARVVVATATKALQDQLAGKDLPFLAGRSPTASTGPCSRAAATTSACSACASCTTTPPGSSSWRG